MDAAPLTCSTAVAGDSSPIPRGTCISRVAQVELAGMNRVPESLWNELPITGRNLPGSTLATALGTEPTLLIFLRHLG